MFYYAVINYVVMRQQTNMRSRLEDKKYVRVLVVGKAVLSPLLD